MCVCGVCVCVCVCVCVREREREKEGGVGGGEASNRLTYKLDDVVKWYAWGPLTLSAPSERFGY